MALTYRADIDGLRALAILPVVLFHAGVSGVPGGFVGVDVFFVISGFLITSLIQKEIAEHRFSYLSFWERRARRLLAPIIVVTVATLLAGWLLLLPDDFRYLGQSVAGIAAFASNLVFWRKSGYFEAEDETIPLLHSWSLAVEEQYYLVFPALLMLLATAQPRTRSFWILALAAVSLGLSTWWTRTSPDSAYYLLPSRGFELMIGALLALNPPTKPLGRVTADLMAVVGLLLIMGAIVLFDGATPFPGYAALIPCLGTALLIRAGAPQGSFIARAFTLRPFVELGKLSYSLYLWHWPIIVFWAVYRRSPIEKFGAAEISGLMLASLLFAWLSYRFVETPVRERRILKTSKRLAGASFASLGLLLLIGVAIHRLDGVPERLPENIRVIPEVAADWTPRQRMCGDLDPDDIPCEIGAQSSSPTFVVWGDSHAQAMFEALDRAAQKNGMKGLFLSRGACPPLPGVQPRGGMFAQACPAFNDNSLQTIERLRPQFVLLIARWSSYQLVQYTDSASPSAEAALFDLVKKLQSSGIEVAVMEEVPNPEYFIPSTFGTGIWRFGLDPSEVGIASNALATRNAHWRTLMSHPSLKNVVRLDPGPALCDASWCPVFRNSRPLYRDSNHLTNYGAAHLVPVFERTLRELTCQATAC